MPSLRLQLCIPLNVQKIICLYLKADFQNFDSYKSYDGFLNFAILLGQSLTRKTRTIRIWEYIHGYLQTLFYNTHVYKSVNS